MNEQPEPVFETDAVIVYDEAGRARRIPYQPTGADLLSIERQRARETARRPLEELLIELRDIGLQMAALERGRVT